MDNIPIEYSERMMAEQLVMMEALQFIMQLLICFAILIAIVVLIVEISGVVRARLGGWRSSEHLQQSQSRAARQRGSAPIPTGENRV